MDNFSSPLKLLLSAPLQAGLKYGLKVIHREDFHRVVKKCVHLDLHAGGGLCLKGSRSAEPPGFPGGAGAGGRAGLGAVRHPALIGGL